MNGDFSAGDLSLPEAIVVANLIEGPDEIHFSPLFDTAQTIDLTAQLVVKEELAILGPGSDLLTLDAGDGFDGEFGTGDGWRMFLVDDRQSDSMALSIAGMMLTGGDVARNGGAILHQENLTLDDVNISANAAGNVGGGIYAWGASLITLGGATDISGARITANVAGRAGGGIYASAALLLKESVLAQNHAEDGGGAYLARGSSTISNSLIHENFALESGGGIAAFDGEALVTNTTLSTNAAGRYGGGVYAGGFFNLLTVENSTLVDNEAGVHGAGAFSSLPASRFVITNTILASSSTSDDLWGLASGANNLIGDGGGDLPGTIAGSPLVGPLADNGGPTWTHALLPGSPAIDAGDAELGTILPFDQRGDGFARIADGGTSEQLDIGAYEAQIAPSADFDEDGVVGGSDFLTWQRGIGAANAQRIDGDSDGDADADASDLAAWAAQYGRLANTQPGDLNFDNSVNGLDLLAWQQGYGTLYDASDLEIWKSNYGEQTPVTARTSTARFVDAVMATERLEGLLDPYADPSRGATLRRNFRPRLEAPAGRCCSAGEWNCNLDQPPATVDADAPSCLAEQTVVDVFFESVDADPRWLEDRTFEPVLGSGQDFHRDRVGCDIAVDLGGQEERAFARDGRLVGG